MKKILILLAFTLVASVSNAQISTTIIANTDNVEITNGGSVTYNVLCNDTYISPDSITISINTTASNGTVTDNGDGSFTYINSGNYDNDTITYTLSHILGNSDNGTVNITNTSIAPINNSPIATNDVDSAYMGLDVVVSVLSNDNDPDSDPMTVTNTTNGNNGTVITNGTTITYTPTDTNWAGYDTVTYTISDNNGGLDTATVFIQSGSSAQINSYNIISPHFGISLYLISDWGNSFLTINDNGWVDQTGTGPTSTLGADWIILPNGVLKFIPPNNPSAFSTLTVEPLSTQISTVWYYGFTLGGAYNYIEY